ncbi:MAG: hypothetical protein K0M40_14300 [Prolixibacteraceae bacterium]|nr:hypothetical protein [Prolixibacteraceae bacterium]
MRYWNYDGGIAVSIQIAQRLEIFTIEGKCYQKLSIQPGEIRIQLPRGFYIFSIKNYRFKVVVI